MLAMSTSRPAAAPTARIAELRSSAVTGIRIPIGLDTSARCTECGITVENVFDGMFRTGDAKYQLAA